MLKITCDYKTKRKLSELKEFQEDIKTISDKNLDKLIMLIETHGFNVPFIIWGDYIMDGHQRKKALTKMGCLEDEVPVVIIEAEDKKDAKEKLLAITSQHGVFNIEGLEDFTKGLTDLDSLSLVDGPHLNLDFKVKIDTPEEKPEPLSDNIEIVDSDEYKQAETEEEFDEIIIKEGDNIPFPDGSAFIVGSDVLFAEEMIRHWNSRNRTRKVSFPIGV